MDPVSSIVDRFTSAIYTAADPQAGIELLSAAAIELGFSGACCCLWPRTCITADDPPPPCLVVYGPHDDASYRSWFDEYTRSSMHAVDPCFALCRSSSAPFAWSSESSPQVFHGCGLGPAQLLALDAMQRCTGLRSGIAVPLQAPGSWFGYCSFACASSLDCVLERRDELEDPLLAMSYRYYDAMADRLGRLIARNSGLEEQELECLALLAVGKTVEEIARIRGLPYSTVRSRLRKAERKLAARNRSHAIAMAAALGLLEGIH